MPCRCLSLLIALLLAAATPARAERWARFRGPGGQGIRATRGFPTSWHAKDYAWKVKLPGKGHSSPCVWDARVFITSASADGKRILLALEAPSGKVVWQRTIDAKPHKIHGLNSFASATPAADGKRVFTLFTDDEAVWVSAFDFAGKPQWQVNLGPFYNRHGHGSGTSPIVFEDSVIVSIQHDGDSFVAALDSATGKPRWKTPCKSRLTGHCTPIIVESADGTPRLFFTNTGDGMACLNPRTGKRIWQADVFPARAVGSLATGHGLIFGTCGGGGRGRVLLAMPVDGEGQLTEEAAAWTADKNLPYVPTPIVYGKHLYLWGDNGVVQCVEALSGKRVWIQRVHGGDYSGSPVCVDGKLYCSNRRGEVVVVAASPKYQRLGVTPLGEGCHSTPAIADGRMYFRGFVHLFCLPAK